MAKEAFQVIVPGWMTRIDDKVLICTNGIAWPKGVWIMPIDKSYKRFIKNWIGMRLAKKYGVSFYTISKIKTGKLWPHVK